MAGNGTAGYSGDFGPAVDAELNDPWGMAVAPDGTIYVADNGNDRIRAISPLGIITTVAGDGQTGSAGMGGPAVDAEVGHPDAVAVDSQGNLYIADETGIQVVSPGGTLTMQMAAASGVLTINGVPTAFDPDAIAVDPSGNLYIGSFSPKLLLEFSPTGQLLGDWTLYVSPGGLSMAPDGSVWVADYGFFSIDRVAGGQLTKVVTFGPNSLPGLPSTFRPSGIGVAPSGETYFDTDGVNGGTNTPALATFGATGQVQLLGVGAQSP